MLRGLNRAILIQGKQLAQGLARSTHFKNIYLFICLLLAVSCLRCCVSCSLVVASGGYSLVGVLRALIAVASLVEHGP